MYIVLILLISSFRAYSMDFDWTNFQTSSIQFGTWLENYKQVRSTRDDSVNGFDLVPFISLSSAYYFNKDHQLIPELGYVIQRTENNIDNNLVFIKFDYAYQMKKWLRLRAGTSFMMLMQSGSGGEDTLNNANTTETYFIPSERRTSFNQTVDFGIELIENRTSARIQTYIYAFSDNDQRLTTVSLSLNYNIPTSEIFN